MIYCVSFITVFFVGIAIDLACGPEPDPYDYYVSFFHNNIQKTDGYAPFYFNGYTFLNGYTNDIDDESKAAERDINVKEWMDYFGHGVTYKDVSRILYELDERTDSIYFRNYADGREKMPDSLKNNSFLKKLKENKRAMSYFILAKKSEPLVNPSDGDQWKDTVVIKNKQHAFALKYLDMGIKLNYRFLKLRCFYQAQRLLHYGGYYDEASVIYNNHIKGFHSRSHVKGWSLSLKAGEEGQFKHTAKAAYLYSRVFAICPERRVRAYFDFMETKVPVNKVIKLAKNKSEIAFIYAIQGLHNPRISLSSLKSVYNIDPGSEMLSILLTREINKIEETYLTPKISGRNYFESIGYYDHTRFDSLKNQYVAYIPRLQKFCIQLANERKYTEPEVGYLAAAYLAWIQGNTNAGLTYLASIKNKNLRGKLFEEKQLINVLLLSQNVKQLNKTTEARLLPSLMWLDKMIKKESFLKHGVYDYDAYDLKFYSASARDFYEKVLAPIYFKQKDTVMAALCILKSKRTIPLIARYGYAPRLAFDLPDFWQNKLHSFQLEKILKWNSSAQKTAYLDLLMKNVNKPTTVIVSGDKPFKGGGYEYTETRHSRQTVIPALYDLLGTIYLREHKYTAAIRVFRHLNTRELENSTSLQMDYQPFKVYNSYPVPFADKLKDYPKGYSNKKGEGYSKLAFAEAMAALQHKIKTNPKQAAGYYYQMALGLYNTSYYGSAWSYTVYQQADSDVYRTKGPYYDRDYLKQYTAEAYFLKARSLSNDNELKARCTFMAAKCAQSQIAVPRDYGSYLDVNESTPKTRAYNKAVRKNLYFYDLKKRYQKTKFYKLAEHECSYFRDFLKSDRN